MLNLVSHYQSQLPLALSVAIHLLFNLRLSYKRQQKDIIMKHTNYTPTRWTRADALKVNENDPTTTQPLVSSDFPVMSDTIFIWDTMPLRELDGTVVSVNGWSVIFTRSEEH